MNSLLKPLAIAALLSPAISFATVFTFDLQGKAGFDLLPGNENHTVNGMPGTGGEFGGGITFDDVTNIITIDVAWGSANGFTDLTGNATIAHIHSSFANFPGDTGTGAFIRSGGVVVGLDNQPAFFTFNNSATSGLITGSITLEAPQVTQLFAGQLYINVHTSLNGPGEIRGNLVNATAIPEL